jgi:hypothetical protein
MGAEGEMEQEGGLLISRRLLHSTWIYAGAAQRAITMRTMMALEALGAPVQVWAGEEEEEEEEF